MHGDVRQARKTLPDEAGRGDQRLHVKLHVGATVFHCCYLMGNVQPLRNTSGRGRTRCVRAAPCVEGAADLLKYSASDILIADLKNLATSTFKVKVSDEGAGYVQECD